MNYSPVTLLDVFPLDEIRPEHFADIPSKNMKALKAAVKDDLRKRTWPEAAREIQHRIADILAVGVSEILHDALQPGPPVGKKLHVTLDYPASLRVLVGGRTSSSLAFHIQLGVLLSGVQVSAGPAGQVFIDIDGHCEIGGSLSCEGTVLLALPLRPFRAPGRLAFPQAS